jgi:hypothetical protein
MQRTLPARAIDNAFIVHVGGLFDRFCSDLEIESKANPDEARSSSTPSARARFERSFGFARATHSQMMEHLDKLKDNEL